MTSQNPTKYQLEICYLYVYLRKTRKKARVVDNRPPLLLANNLLPLRVLLLADHLPALLGLPTLPPIMPLLDNICLVDEPARRKVSFLYFGLMEFECKNLKTKYSCL